MWKSLLCFWSDVQQGNLLKIHSVTLLKAALLQLSGPVLRDTARLSQRYPPYCTLLGFWCLNMANWVRYPLPLFWAFPPWRAREVEVLDPPSKWYLSDTCAIPHENKANGCDTPLCDTISKGYCAIWGGISHWAAKCRVAPVRFGSATVWGWNGSSGSGFRFRRFLWGGGFCVFQYSFTGRTVPVPVSVPGKRLLRFRFRVQFLGKRFRRFRFPVLVRFLGHPVSVAGTIIPWKGPKGIPGKGIGKSTLKIPWKHREKSWNSWHSVLFPYALCGYALCTRNHHTPTMSLETEANDSNHNPLCFEEETDNKNRRWRKPWSSYFCLGGATVADAWTYRYVSVSARGSRAGKQSAVHLIIWGR